MNVFEYGPVSEPSIAMIGLGAMGAPMADNLLSAGFNLAGYNRSPAAVRRLERRGGRAAVSIADAVKDADVVITMLPDGPDVAEVVLGDAGVLAHAKSGAVWIDCSTIDPALSRTLAERAREHHLRPLDAPVSGGVRGAIDRTLSIMVGGLAEDLESVRAVLDGIGTTIVHVGPAGSGQTVKAANQIIVAGTLAVVAEAVKLLESNEVELEPALRVLNAGLAASRVLETKASAMISRDFRPGFRVSLHHKDLGIALGIARDRDLPLPMTGLVAQLLVALRAQGRGSDDHGALIALLDSLSSPPPPKNVGVESGFAS